MGVVKVGMTGAMLTAGALMAAPALAVSQFETNAQLGATVTNLGQQAPNNAFVRMRYVEGTFLFPTQTGDTFVDFTETNDSPGFATAPQSGPGGAFGTGIDVTSMAQTVLGGFTVQYEGMATEAPGVESNVQGGNFAPSFPGAAPTFQEFEFFAETATSLQISLFPIIQFAQFEAAPGGSVNAGAQFFFDDLSTVGIDYAIGVINTPDDPLIFPVGFASVGYNGNLVDDGNGGLLTFAIEIGDLTSGNGGESLWRFGYETFGGATVPPGPESEVPVPAALPLLATAMGGLFWMKRRRKA